MDSHKLLTYLQDPELLDERSFFEINRLVRDYPYFQLGRILMIKCLQNQKDPSFSDQLNVTAAYIPDRKTLFKLLNKEPESYFEDLKNIKVFETRMEKPGRKTRSFVKAERKSAEPTKENIESIIKRRKQHKQADISQTNKKPDRKIISPIPTRPFRKAKPKEKELLDFDYLDSSEDIMSYDLEEDILKTDENSDVTWNLIDNFIEQKPRMNPKESKLSSIEDISLGSLSDSEDLITETLVEIYISQGYYVRAISGYEKLSLKYPEKSTYFASRIKEIENLIKNQ